MRKISKSYRTELVFFFYVKIVHSSSEMVGTRMLSR